MQPFDALSIRAVLAEARPLIVNRKVDRVTQLGRDEVLLTLRGKSGVNSLFISAQSVHGRMCLVQTNQMHAKGDKIDPVTDRYVSKYGSGGSVPNFCLLLRKHLAGATLIAAEQPLGERIIDLVFSCIDEVGTASIKILTAEIMGRHSNLIFWEKEDSKIVAASHNVTKDMSRQREIAPGLRYERPPSQDRPSLYTVNQEAFLKLFEQMAEVQVEVRAEVQAEDLAKERVQAGAPDSIPGATSNAETTGQSTTIPATIEQWIIATFTGAGRHLCEELVLAAGLVSQIEKARAIENAGDKLWQRVEQLRANDNYRPFLFTDLSRYSVLGWYPTGKNEQEISTKSLPSVNDLIEEYFRSCELTEQCNQLRERLRTDLNQELNKIDARLKMAQQHVLPGNDIHLQKKLGDLILANLTEIKAGQELLEAEDLFGNSGTVTIKLNPNLNAAQNAQMYYRQYAKSRARHTTASQSVSEATARRTMLEEQLQKIEGAKDIFELRHLKENLTGRKAHEIAKPKAKPKKGNDSKILSVNSSDGWTIYVGRNRLENDYLLSRLAQPNDLWFHVLGQGGAHVLIRIPSSKQEPPMTTILEAAQIAARLSKASHGAKVRVVYTQCKHVRKLAKDKPGLVKYEQEKTVEVDTSQPMPKPMKQLFSH
ncbi:NFACT family protein [bacterium]|jgi:predicted ribosome quality control (RQC) complex YloA/Tae2 family protein|nr:NFACT family protein [bacterium]